MQVTSCGCLPLCACVCLAVPAEAGLMAPPNGSHAILLAGMAARRGWGSDGIYFDHAGPSQLKGLLEVWEHGEVLHVEGG
jgi:hypothetical protein